MDFAEQQRNPGKHVVGIGVVLALHAVLAWALVNGLAQRLVEVIKAPIETKIIEEVKPPEPPPPENLPPPPPQSAPPPPSFIPPPEVRVNPPPMPQPTITTTTVAPPPAPTAPFIQPTTPAAPPAPPAPRSPPKAAITNVGACAPKGEDYPPAAQRAEATGTTAIRFTVGADGKLAKTELIRSAGASREHKLLDRLAISKLSQCSFTAGSDENGKPVGATVDVEYVWKLD